MIDNRNIVYKCDYFYVEKLYIESRKTPIYNLYIKDSNFQLGCIKWYGAWRKFCFYPNVETVWDNKCLTIVIELLDKYNKEWKRKKE